MNIISVKGLRKRFRKPLGQGWVEVLKGLDFEVEKGKITGFLGANGAGKTTTLKCLFGLVKPTKGTIHFFGDEPLTVAQRQRIGFLPERPYFYEYLSGREFLRFYGKLCWKDSFGSLEKAIEATLEKVDLTRAGDVPLRNYSKGMLQRIGFAQAIIHNPELIVLDEPMAGLDPDGRSKLNQLIRSVADSGASIFFSSHLLHDVEVLCENLVILKEGEVAFSGSTDAFLHNLETGFEMRYRQGNEVKHLELKTQEELKKEVARIANDASAEIVLIQSKRPSLEDAFVKLSYGGKS